MPRQWRSRAAVPVVLAIVGWSIAGVLCWALVGRVGWLGVAIIGLVTLLMAYRWSMDEENALPTYPGGANHVYRAQYERQFGRSTPEQRLADGARRAEFDRLLYLIRTIGLALLAVGFNMFVYHQL